MVPDNKKAPPNVKSGGALIYLRANFSRIAWKMNFRIDILSFFAAAFISACKSDGMLRSRYQIAFSISHPPI
jgi:hypothetical protein